MLTPWHVSSQLRRRMLLSTLQSTAGGPLPHPEVAILRRWRNSVVDQCPRTWPMVNHELVTNWILDLRKKLQRQRELWKFCPEQTEGWRCHRLKWENGRCHRLQGKVRDQVRAPEPSRKEFPMQPVSVSASVGFLMMLRVPGSRSFMMQRVSPSHPGPLPAPASSWQPGARLQTWRPATVSSFAAASQRRISRPVVSCGRVAATRSRTGDSWPWCPSRSPRCVACRLFVLKKVGRERPCETTPGAKSDPYKAHVLPEHRGTVALDGRRKRKQLLV
ncbi:PREDICTED: uncharacterized protein LOC105592917, partial [Cercocebus atys]|uniref:uncharacterized protein LOC105592917 n=1 Tax=Cercocebus atys TaxID=9531 RepID=UPI0005F4E325